MRRGGFTLSVTALPCHLLQRGRLDYSSVFRYAKSTFPHKGRLIFSSPWCGGDTLCVQSLTHSPSTTSWSPSLPEGGLTTHPSRLRLSPPFPHEGRGCCLCLCLVFLPNSPRTVEDAGPYKFLPRLNQPFSFAGGEHFIRLLADFIRQGVTDFTDPVGRFHSALAPRAARQGRLDNSSEPLAALSAISSQGKAFCYPASINLSCSRERTFHPPVADFIRQGMTDFTDPVGRFHSALAPRAARQGRHCVAPPWCVCSDALD